MSYHKQLIVVLAVGAVAVGSLAYLSRGPSPSPAKIDKVRVVEGHKPPRKWAIDAAYGRGALSSLRSAFIELSNHNAEQARMGVVAARSLLSEIKRERPRAVDASRGEDDFVLVHMEIHAPGGEKSKRILRSKLDTMRRDIDMSDQGAVTAALRELKMPLTYTRVDLPVSRTIAEIDYVLEALNSNDAGRASATLSKISDALRIETVKIENFEPPANAPTDGGDAG